MFFSKKSIPFGSSPAASAVDAAIRRIGKASHFIRILRRERFPAGYALCTKKEFRLDPIASSITVAVCAELGTFFVMHFMHGYARLCTVMHGYAGQPRLPS